MTADPRGQAAAALRHLGHALMAHEVDDDLLVTVAEAADRVRGRVEAGQARVRDLEQLRRTMFGRRDLVDGGLVSHFPECFVSGAHNPLGIAIAVRVAGEEVVADVDLGPAFEGAPDRAHGGIVAAVFDDVMGYLLTVHDQPGFTGELTVRYLAATPIGERVTFRARVTDHAGRRVFATSEATTVDGRVVARADATFVTVEAMTHGTSRSAADDA